MSAKYFARNSGPEMAAPILWALGIFWFFLLESPQAQKFRLLGGVFGIFWKGGGGSADFNIWTWGFFRECHSHPRRIQYPYRAIGKKEGTGSEKIRNKSGQKKHKDNKLSSKSTKRRLTEMKLPERRRKLKPSDMLPELIQQQKG